MAEDPNSIGTAFNLASRWYLSFLRAELHQKGDPDADQHLDELIRIVPSPENKPEAGAVVLRLQYRVTDYEVRINAETGESISWFADFLALGGSASMGAEQALRMARTFIDLPSGAELDTAEFETAGNSTFFRARWLHRHNDLPVEGDYLEVLLNVDAGRPFSISRFWRTPNLTRTPAWR
jgi:hypothetical protein